MHRRFSLRQSVQDTTVIVTVSGAIGPDTAANLGHALMAAISDPAASHVVVDLASVDFIDEMGLEILVMAQRAAFRHHGACQDF
jgi:anti-anti-sigma factor